jgi:hypothetical protein
MNYFRALLRPFQPLVRALRTTRRTAAAVPDLVDAILILPALSRQLEVVAFQTATLVEMHEELARVRANTAVLPHLDSELAHVHDVLCHVDQNTQAVQQLADVALPLHGAALRFGRFADRLPQRRADLRARRTGAQPFAATTAAPSPSAYRTGG